jgi:hypothetical protein
MVVYGPYIRTVDNRKFIVEVNDGKYRTKMYAVYLLEQKLGRELSHGESVDHINDDHTDDSIENLQVLPIGDNVRKSHPKAARIHGTITMATHGKCKCDECKAVKNQVHRDYMLQRKRTNQLLRSVLSD